MIIIRKFPIDTKKVKGHIKTIKFGISDGNICVWALIDLDSSYEYEVTYNVLCTGQEINAGIYLDTIFQGSVVWHIFRN